MHEPKLDKWDEPELENSSALRIPYMIFKLEMHGYDDRTLVADYYIIRRKEGEYEFKPVDNAERLLLESPKEIHDFLIAVAKKIYPEK